MVIFNSKLLNYQRVPSNTVVLFPLNMKRVYIIWSPSLGREPGMGMVMSKLAVIETFNPFP